MRAYVRSKRELPERLELREELREQRPVVVHVDEERVVALQRVQLDELDLAVRRFEPFRELALLIDREQEVRLHTDDQRALDRELAQRVIDRRAVLGHVEEIAR